MGVILNKTLKTFLRTGQQDGQPTKTLFPARSLKTCTALFQVCLILSSNSKCKHSSSVVLICSLWERMERFPPELCNISHCDSSGLLCTFWDLRWYLQCIKHGRMHNLNERAVLWVLLRLHLLHLGGERSEILQGLLQVHVLISLKQNVTKMLKPSPSIPTNLRLVPDRSCVCVQTAKIWGKIISL